MMSDLKTQFNTAILLTTHDLGVAAQTCQKVAIIYAGSIVEFGTVDEIFKDLRHPYTMGLMGSIPNITEDVHRLRPIRGLMPDPMNLPKGCAFRPRCNYAMPQCKANRPGICAIPGTQHYVCCFHAEKMIKEGGGGNE